MKSLYPNTLLALTITALTACGGGGGGGGSSNDADRNTAGSGPGSNEILALMQDGLYEFSMYYDYNPGPDPIGSANLARHRLNVVNGVLEAETDYLDFAGWIPKADYYDDDVIRSQDIVLTPTGWIARADTPCTVAADANAVVLECPGSRSRLTLEATDALATTAVGNLLTEIAGNEFSEQVPGTSDVAAYQGVVTAIAALTDTFGAETYRYHFRSVSETPEVVTLDCAPTAASQPVDQWTCETAFTSRSWAELDVSEEAFSLYYADQNGESQFAQVKLEGDLATADSGNIVVVEVDFGTVAPGTVAGSWEKISVHGEDIIRLTPSDVGSQHYKALILVNGVIVEGIYAPAGRVYPFTALNAAAATTLSDVATGIFPVVLPE